MITSLAFVQHLQSLRNVYRVQSFIRLMSALLLVLCCQIAHANSYTAKVVRIIDGDTLVVLDSDNHLHRIRLAGIDAPEKKQPFGNVSRKNLADIAFGQIAVVNAYKLDRYGRELAVVLIQNIDVGLFQIRSGLALHYKKYMHEQSSNDRVEYARSELDAKYNKIGLWSQEGLIEPWSFRRRR